MAKIEIREFIQGGQKGLLVGPPPPNRMDVNPVFVYNCNAYATLCVWNTPVVTQSGRVCIFEPGSVKLKIGTGLYVDHFDFAYCGVVCEFAEDDTGLHIVAALDTYRNYTLYHMLRHGVGIGVCMGHGLPLYNVNDRLFGDGLMTNRQPEPLFVLDEQGIAHVQHYEVGHIAVGIPVGFGEAARLKLFTGVNPNSRPGQGAENL